MMKVTVDNHENRGQNLIRALRALGDVPFSVRELKYGDVLFEDEGGVVLTIERKTKEDLAASIKDRRMYEQKERMLEYSPVVWYVVEGLAAGSSKFVGGLPRTTLFSALERMTLRAAAREHRLWVHHTRDAEGTARMIQRLFLRSLALLNTPGDDPDPSQKRARYELKALAPSRKGNRTPELTYLDMLARIPGVSGTVAAAVRKEFNTPAALAAEITRRADVVRPLVIARKAEKRKGWRKAEGAAIAFLSDIPVAGGKGPQRVGPAKACAIIGAFLGC